MEVADELSSCTENSQSIEQSVDSQESEFSTGRASGKKKRREVKAEAKKALKVSSAVGDATRAAISGSSKPQAAEEEEKGESPNAAAVVGKRKRRQECASGAIANQEADGSRPLDPDPN